MPEITETVNVPMPSDALWPRVGGSSTVGDWHPMLARVVSEGRRPHCIRRAEGKDGSTQVERLSGDVVGATFLSLQD
jgi:hypothetical protein